MNTQTFYTPNEVSMHCSASDCWITKFNRVYDYTNLLKSCPSNLSTAIIKSAGKDVTHWFDPATGDFFKVISPLDEELRYRLPLGLLCKDTPDVYLPIEEEIDHLPIEHVDAAAATCDNPWWRDEHYCIGLLSSCAREIDILNALTKQKHRIEVPGELIISEIAGRYACFNSSCLQSYEWHYNGEKLNMGKTLDENGIKDDRDIMLKLNWPAEKWEVPCIILIWKDECL